MEPIGIAHHGDDAILAVTGREVLWDLNGEILGRHADLVLAAFDFFLCRGAIGSIAGRGDLGSDPSRLFAGAGSRFRSGRFWFSSGLSHLTAWRQRTEKLFFS